MKYNLSLCMIVKNEEKFLAQCLAAARDCADEIVLVDTGSTDRTREIAAQFGARIFEHPWENHFSKHRNQSIAYARSDWILWLDADEVLATATAPLIKEAIRNPEIDSLLTTMICFYENRGRTSWNNTVKLFRNGLGIHFEGAVHNQVVGCKKTGFCPVKIYHYGYDQDQKTVQKKFERTSRLLQKAIQEDPRNFRPHHDLAVAFASMHCFTKTIGAGLKAIECYQAGRENDPNILWTYFVVASACFNLGQLERARDLALRALALNPEHLDSLFVLAAVYAAQKNRPGFEEAYRAFARLAPEYRAHPERLAGLVMNKLDEQWRLDLEYGGLLLSSNSESAALPVFAQALQQAPDPANAHCLAARICRKAGAPNLCRDFLKRATDAGLASGVARFEEVLLKRALGEEKIARSLLLELIHEEPKDMGPETMTALGIEALKLGKFIRAQYLLQAALAQGYATPNVFNHLSLAFKYQGRFAEAVEYGRKVLTLDENDLNALVNLGHLYYEQKKWAQARPCYQKALEISPAQTDVLLRLSLIALADQDLPECLRFCDRLLTALDRTCNREIASPQDLAEIYRLIAETFQARNQNTLAREAALISSHLSS